MMKRILAISLCLLLLLPALPALGAGARGRVVNCEEWVSLRAAPDTSAQRLAQVPLGAEVTDCALAGNGFVACAYAGQAGYILGDYLSDSRVGGSYTRVLADDQFAGLRIVIEAGETATGEAVRATAYAEDGALIWRQELATEQRTELTLVDGFLGGVEKRPLAYLYAMGDGLTAYDAASGEAAWRVPTDAVNLGGSITHAVDADGTIYVGGYYGPEPVAISSAGEVLWQAHTGNDVYWLTDLQVTSEGVLAAYEVVGFEGNNMRPGTVLYDRETGETLEVTEE